MTPEKPRLDDLRIDHKPARKPSSQFNLALPALLIVVLAVAWFWWRSRSSAVEVETALVRESTTQAGRTVLNASGYVTAPATRQPTAMPSRNSMLLFVFLSLLSI